jgi:hypothetical protein
MLTFPLLPIEKDSAGAIKTLRLARLVRLLTIVKNVPELKVIVEGLIAGLKSVGYIVLLLLLVRFVYKNHIYKIWTFSCIPSHRMRYALLHGFFIYYYLRSP